MGKDWRGSEDAKQRLIAVLQKTSVPLETQTNIAVRRFCAKYVGSPLRAVPLGSLLWRSDDDAVEEKALRELDGGALISENLAFDGVRVPIQAYVCIEAKYREGLEWFGFPTQFKTRFPVASNAVYSQLVDQVYSEDADDLELYHLAAILTGSGIADKPFEEKLTQNTCAGLADFALHLARGHSRTRKEPVADFSRMKRIVEEFEQSIGESDDWRAELETYLMNLPMETYTAFYEEMKEQQAIILRFFIPILCVNGRLNRVEMSDDGQITEILPMEFAVTGERLPRWPSRDVFLAPASHFPLIVANPAGIEAALQVAYDHIMKVRNAFMDAGARNKLNGTALEIATSTAILARRGIRMRAF